MGWFTNVPFRRWPDGIWHSKNALRFGLSEPRGEMLQLTWGTWSSCDGQVCPSDIVISHIYNYIYLYIILCRLTYIGWHIGWHIYIYYDIIWYPISKYVSQLVERRTYLAVHLFPPGGFSSEPRRKGDEVPQFPPSGANVALSVGCWELPRFLDS